MTVRWTAKMSVRQGTRKWSTHAGSGLYDLRITGTVSGDPAALKVAGDRRAAVGACWGSATTCARALFSGTCGLGPVPDVARPARREVPPR